MSDKYDDDIAYLTTHPDMIEYSWNYGGLDHTIGRCLFAYATRSGHNEYINGYECGCLTQVKSCRRIAETPELTAAIRNDDRIPDNRREITPENLHVFAEWQRRIDKELRSAVMPDFSPG